MFTLKRIASKNKHILTNSRADAGVRIPVIRLVQERFDHVENSRSILAYKICLITLCPPLCKVCSGAGMRYIAG